MLCSALKLGRIVLGVKNEGVIWQWHPDNADKHL